MPKDRPNPDELLAQVQAEEARSRQGRLKLFIGATAGVGKTYRMLGDARDAKARGVDVVIGLIETHGRRETEEMAEGLERLPLREVSYRGRVLKEFDLDAALARRPEIVLVDELAHTNAPGSRHQKRWQDVMELLEAGISVYTAVNIQHFESLNDIVGKITNTRIQETIPDLILERADEVELVDTPPDELIQRLHEGKVYVPAQAQIAIQNFFRRGNLIALRELALRLTAERVEADMEMYRRESGVRTTWAATERILVCVAPNELASRIVRAAFRMARGFHAEMIVLTVETPRTLKMSEKQRGLIVAAHRLAEKLGAETVTLTSEDVVREILDYAREKNVTKIVVGKPIKPRWRERLFGSVVDELVRQSGEIDVYVITSLPEREDEEEKPRRPWSEAPRQPLGYYGIALLVVAVCTGLALLLATSYNASSSALVYLMGVVLAATKLGAGPTLAASLASVLAHRVAVVEANRIPVSNGEQVLIASMLVAIGAVVANLTERVRAQARSVSERARRTAALYELSRKLAVSQDPMSVVRASAAQISTVFDAEVVIYLAEENSLRCMCDSNSGFERSSSELAVARWVYDHGAPAGRGTETLLGAEGLYLPLSGTRGPIGVLALKTQNRAPLDPQQMDLLETFANQVALALERARLVQESQRVQVRNESARVRNSLFTSVSHDFQEPVEAIIDAARRLRDATDQDRETRKECERCIEVEVERMSQLLGDISDLTRIETGEMPVRYDWVAIEEIARRAVALKKRSLGDRKVEFDFEEDLPLLKVDPRLVQQVFINLLEIAIRSSDPDATLRLRATRKATVIEFELSYPGMSIADEPGEDRLRFEEAASGGLGLGMTICREILRLHAGRIFSRNRLDGGGSFRFTIPLPDEAPPTALGSEREDRGEAL